MIILLVHGQVRTIRNDVASGCRRRCRTSRVIAGGLQLITELVYVTLMRMVMFVVIRALLTLGRFCFPRSSRVGFLGVLFLVVGLVDLMRAIVKSFAIREEVRVTRKLKKKTANINISKRILRLKVVNDIVHGRTKGYGKVACFGFIELKVHKELEIACLIIVNSTAFSSVCVLPLIKADMVWKDIGILYVGREEEQKCMVK